MKSSGQIKLIVGFLVLATLTMLIMELSNNKASDRAITRQITEFRSITTTFGFTADEYPHIDGSLSIKPFADMITLFALDLGPLLEASSKNGIEYDIKASYPSHADKQHRECYDALTRQNHHQGTHEAYLALLNSKPASTESVFSLYADLIFVLRKPTEEESKLAASRGIDFDIRTIALDAVVFLVNGKNPIKSRLVRD